MKNIIRLVVGLLTIIVLGFTSCSKKTLPVKPDDKTVVPDKPVVTSPVLWEDVDASTIKVIGEPGDMPLQFRTLKLNTLLMKASLAKKAGQLELPLPEGGMGTYKIKESATMDPALLARFPNLRTYSGKGISEPSSTAKLDFVPSGFHSYMTTDKGAVIIRPLSTGDSLHYISFYMHYSTEKKLPFEQNYDTTGQRK